MIRKATAILVLISMITHCAGRLGFLSYLYQQRHEIAAALGFIEEKPIALCGSDFQPEANLIVQADESDASVPPQLLNAPEIHLFFQSKTVDITPSGLFSLGDVLNTSYSMFEPPVPVVDILQPPKI